MLGLAGVAFLWTLAGVGCGSGGGGQSCPAKNPPSVAGEWLASQATVSDDDCSQGLADEFAARIEGSTFPVGQNGSQVTLAEGVYEGCVDDSGEISANASVSSQQEGCNTSVDVDLSGNFSESPTDVSFAFLLRTSGSSCANTSCMFTVGAEFTRVATTAHSEAREEGSGAEGLRGALGEGSRSSSIRSDTIRSDRAAPSAAIDVGAR
jgi:hypothetical protein